MISKKNILFIGDPFCIHNLKWITWFTSTNNCMIIGMSADYLNRTIHTEKILTENKIRLFENPLPEFSTKQFWKTKKALNRIDKIIQDNKIDLVHIMYGTNIPWAYQIKKPIFLTTRGSDILIDLPRFFSGYNGPIWRKIYRKVVQKISIITCTSLQQVERVKDLFPNFDETKIHALRTGVNVEEIQKLGKGSDIKRDKYRFLLPRYILPNYNNELILKAIGLLSEETQKKITLVMILPVKEIENYTQEILKLANTLKCKLEVKTEMSQTDMWLEYFKAGICIMTPLSDGTPNTAFEAMSANCPLVLPPIPYDKGLFENVTIQLKSYEIGELHETLLQYTNDQLVIDTDAAFNRVLVEGSRNQMMNKLNSLYEKTLHFNGEIICSNCVLSNFDDPKISFNEKGICNHCLKYENGLSKNVFQGDTGLEKWNSAILEMKNAGKNKQYDCILGISGGTDSTYLALKAKEAGLRVLCIHLDNGWNSKEAVSNIKNIIQKLKFDLFTYVLDWEEFKDIQLSYFKSGVLDLDVPTDHAMLACLYQQAIKHKIKYILSGHNYVTESILPSNFNFDKGDSQNLINIHSKFGKIPLNTFPLFGQKHKYLVSYFYKLKSIRPLNFLEYNKEKAKKEITEKLGWKDYGAKHYENIFTRFYQGYILPNRFGIDKRKAHLSNLICSKQITRDEALNELKQPTYDLQQIELDKKFVLNKFDLTEEEFQKYMSLPIISHEEYGVEIPWSHYFGFHLIKKKD